MKHTFSVIKESPPKSWNITQNMYICACVHKQAHTSMQRERHREREREPTKKIANSSFLFMSNLSLKIFSFWFLSLDIKPKKTEVNYSLLMLTHNILSGFFPCWKTHNEHPGSEV